MPRVVTLLFFTLVSGLLALSSGPRSAEAGFQLGDWEDGPFRSEILTSSSFPNKTNCFRDQRPDNGLPLIVESYCIADKIIFGGDADADATEHARADLMVPAGGDNVQVDLSMQYSLYIEEVPGSVSVSCRADITNAQGTTVLTLGPIEDALAVVGAPGHMTVHDGNPNFFLAGGTYRVDVLVNAHAAAGAVTGINAADALSNIPFHLPGRQCEFDMDQLDGDGEGPGGGQGGGDEGPPSSLTCIDGADNDADTLVDSADPDCISVGGTTELLASGLDAPTSPAGGPGHWFPYAAIVGVTAGTLVLAGVWYASRRWLR